MLQALPPGEYRALAWEEPDNYLTAAPEVLNQFVTWSSSLKLGPGAHEIVDLKLVSKEESDSVFAKFR